MKDILEKEIQIGDLYPPTNVVRTGSYVTKSILDSLTARIQEFPLNKTFCLRKRFSCECIHTHKT